MQSTTKQIPNGGAAFEQQPTSKLEDTSYLRFATPQTNDPKSMSSSHPPLSSSVGAMGLMRPPSATPFYQRATVMPRSAVVNQPMGHFRQLATVEASRIVTHQPPTQANSTHGFYTIFLDQQSNMPSIDGQTFTTAGSEYTARNPSAAYHQPAYIFHPMLPYATAPQNAQQGWSATGMPPVGIPTAAMYRNAPHNVVPLMAPTPGAAVYQSAAPGVAPPGALLGPVVGQNFSTATSHGQQPSMAPHQPKRERHILQIIDPNSQKDVIQEFAEENLKLQHQTSKGTVFYSNSSSLATTSGTLTGSTTPSLAARHTLNQPPHSVGANVAAGVVMGVPSLSSRSTTAALPTPRATGGEDYATAASTVHIGETTALHRPKQSPSPTGSNSTQQQPDDEKKNLIYCELALNIAEVTGPDSSTATGTSVAAKPPPSKVTAALTSTTTVAAMDIRRTPAATDPPLKKAASDDSNANATGFSFGFFGEQDASSTAQVSKSDSPLTTIIPAVSVSLSAGDHSQVVGASIVTTATSAALSSAKITASVKSAKASSSEENIDSADKFAKPAVFSQLMKNVDSSVLSLVDKLITLKSPTSWFYDNPSGEKVYSRDYMVVLFTESPLSQTEIQLAPGISEVTDIRNRSNATELYLREGRSPFDQALGGLVRAPAHLDTGSGSGGGQQPASFKPSWMPGSQVPMNQRRYAGRSSAGRGPASTASSGPRGSQDGGGRPPPMVIPRPSLNAAEGQLKRTENAWKPNRAKSDSTKDPEQAKSDMLFHDVKSILNKITPQTFDDLSADFLSLEPRIDTEDRVNGVIDILFSKVCDEPSFSTMYAKLCEAFRSHQATRLQQQQQQIATEADDSQSKLKGFSFYLLCKCQRGFEQEKSVELQREQKLAEIDKASTEEEKKLLKANLEEELNKFKWRTLGSMRFVGELYKLGLLTNFIAHICVIKLLEKTNLGDEDHAECLCKLLTTIGQRMLEKLKETAVDTSKMSDSSKIVTKEMISAYFDQLGQCLKQRKFSKRIQFEIRNLLDLKENNWKPRRQETGPKTLEEVHSEAKLEDYAKKAELDQFSSRKQSQHQSQPQQQQQYQQGQQNRSNQKSGRLPQRGSYGNLSMSTIDDESSSGGGTMGRKKSQANNRSGDVRQQQRDSLGGGRQSGSRVSSQAGVSSTTSDNRAMAVPSLLSRHNIEGVVTLQPTKKLWNKTVTSTTGPAATTTNRFSHLASEDDSKVSAPNSRDSSQSRLSTATTAQTSLRPGGGAPPLTSSSSSMPPPSILPPTSAGVSKAIFETTSSGSSRETSLTREQSTTHDEMDLQGPFSSQQQCLIDLEDHIKSLHPVEPNKLIDFITGTILNFESEDFARALAHSLCSKFFLSVTDNCDDSTLTVSDQFEQCCPVFHRFITGKTNFEKLLLSTLADVYYSKACPKDILTTTFETLSANSVMSRDTFLDWWNSDEAQNRGMILKSNHMKTFFDNLQRQQEITAASTEATNA